MMMVTTTKTTMKSHCPFSAFVVLVFVRYAQGDEDRRGAVGGWWKTRLSVVFGRQYLA